MDRGGRMSLENIVEDKNDIIVYNFVSQNLGNPGGFMAYLFG